VCFDNPQALFQRLGAHRFPAMGSGLHVAVFALEIALPGDIDL
jgi:hypothetical protein